MTIRCRIVMTIRCRIVMPIRCRIYDDYSTIMSDNGLVYDLTFK